MSGDEGSAIACDPEANIRARLVVAAALLLVIHGGCGGSNCSFQILTRLAVEQTVECCGAAARSGGAGL